MRHKQRNLAFWFLLLVSGLFLYQLYEGRKKDPVPDFNYSRFVEAVKASKVAQATFKLDTGQIQGEIKEDFVTEYGGKTFDIYGNISDEGYKLLVEHGLTPNYDRSEKYSFFKSWFVNWLPLIIIIAIFFFVMRQIQSGSGKTFSFGKSRARLLVENKNPITFKDVAGVEEAKADLKEIVQFLKKPQKFTDLGGRIPKGILLVGSPGTGKTLLARAIAGEAKVPFFSISGSDFVEMFVGVGASRVRDLFEQGKNSAPCIIFIDEIDAVGRHRGAGMGGGHDEREQTLNQLLVEMDGFESKEGVILIAATNRADVLDPALLRPGRFDRRVMVHKPDLGGREQILKVHTRKVPLHKTVGLRLLARGTPGFSGAELESLVNEAALIAASKNQKSVFTEDLEQARDKVLMGSERRSMVLTQKDREITAYHEAGHALVGTKLPDFDTIHKVTIIPRGMALGVTQALPNKEEWSYSKSKAQHMMAFLFGGRVAEELIFSDFTSGASNDIERATEIARKMVCEWGMSEKLGPLSYEQHSAPVFVGMRAGETSSRSHSEEKAKEIDQEVHRFITEAYQKATQILKENDPVLKEMAKALLELETINSKEIHQLVEGVKWEEIKSLREQKERKIKRKSEMKAAKKKKAQIKESLGEKDGENPLETTGTGSKGKGSKGGGVEGADPVGA